MSLNLRKTIVRDIAIWSAGFFAIACALSWLARGFSLSLNAAMWCAFFALLFGLWRGWYRCNKLKKEVLLAIPQQYCLQKIVRATCSELHFAGAHITWQEMDEHALTLLNLDYAHLGDFICYPPNQRQTSVAAIYQNRSQSILVEIQFIAHAESMRSIDTRHGVHFSFSSVVGGHIHITTNDHHPNASNALLRGEHDVGACYPKLGLVDLLDKHQRILASVQKRTNKKLTRGLSLERAILLVRERLAWAQHRLNKLDGFAIAQEIDDFEAMPQYKWTPPSLALAACPTRDWQALDSSGLANNSDLILPDGPDMPPVPETAEQLALERALDEELARETISPLASLGVRASANWLHVLAVLSLLNCLLLALGVNLRTGLFFVYESERMFDMPDASLLVQTMFHGISLATILFCALVPASVLHGWIIYRLWQALQLLREEEQLRDLEQNSDIARQIEAGLLE